MPAIDVEIDPDKGIPEIEFIIGEAKYGFVRCRIGDGNYQNRRICKELDNPSTRTIRFPVNGDLTDISEASTLIGSVMGWHLYIIEQDDVDTSNYFLSTKLYQDGELIKELPAQQGEFSEAHIVRGRIRFVAA